MPPEAQDRGIRSLHPARSGERAILPVRARFLGSAVPHAGGGPAPRAGCAAARFRSSGRGSSGGGAGGASPAAASRRRRSEFARSPRRSASRLSGPRRGEAGRLTERSQPARRTGASPVGRSVARGAGGSDRAGVRPGRPWHRPLPGSREDAPGKPRVHRQARFDRQQRHERKPRITLGREVQNVSLPAFPADQEVQRVLVQVGKRDLEDARGFLRHCRCGQQEQAESQQNRTPHRNQMASNPRAAWRAGKGPPTSGRHARERETRANDVGLCPRECRTTFSCGRGKRADPIMWVFPGGAGTAAGSAAKGVYHAAVRMTLNAGVPAERRTTPELGVLPCRPPAAGCADQRSAFPCLRIAPLGGLGAETCTTPELHFHDGRGVQEDPIMGVSPGGGRLGPPASGRHRAGARNPRPWPGLLPK